MPIRYRNFEDFFGTVSQSWFDQFSQDIQNRWFETGQAIQGNAAGNAAQFRADYDSLISAYSQSFGAASQRLSSAISRGEQELRIGRANTLETIQRAGDESLRAAQANLAARGLGGSTVASNVEAGYRERTALTRGRVEEEYAGSLAEYIFRGGVAEAQFANEGARFTAGLRGAQAGGTADLSMRALDMGGRFAAGGLGSWSNARMFYAGNRFATPFAESYVDPWLEMRDAALRQLSKAGTQAGISALTSGGGGP